eukprot:m.29123 g.29123  ORF g.29123 m.29123 type:complete len:134 (+) comp10507_c0_seq1:424-825(+)
MAFSSSSMVVVVAAIAMMACATWTMVSADCPVMCKPLIDHKYTVIQAVPGLRGNAGIEPDYGNCAPGANFYRWTVYWGDGVEMSANSTTLSPYNAIYSYKASGRYNVTIAYCNYPSDCCMSCDYYTKTIDVKN